MKIANMNNPVTSAWLLKEGRRFDANPFLGGAVEARMVLDKLKVRKDPLQSLTKGHDGGIFMPGRNKRVWVTDPSHGTPYLTTSSILQADLSNLSLIANRLIKKDPQLIIKRGMTLITRSGTIGRMAYCRKNMDGLACSEDVLRVVSDPDKIPPGYLYAFLSSKYGVPLVICGTYGAIIQHIEPEHIANLPVPRLGRNLENTIHQEIELSANSLSTFSQKMTQATELVLSYFGLKDISNSEWLNDDRKLGWAENKMEVHSFRGFNYDPRAMQLLACLKQHKCDELGSLCEPERFKGHIVFKRIDSDPEHGRLLVGQRDAFRIRPDGRWLSRNSIEPYNLLTPVGSTLIPSHGTLGENELYCRAIIVTERTSEYAFSGDFYRCIPTNSSIPTGYLHAILRSRIAFRLLRSMATGGKQQYQHPKLIWEMPIPRSSERKEIEVHDLVMEGCTAFDQALQAEENAWKLIEEAIQSDA